MNPFDIVGAPPVLLDFTLHVTQRFASPFSTGPTEAQRAFEGVLKDVERPLIGLEDDQGEEASVTLRSNNELRSFDWTVSTGNKGERRLVMRVMQLLKEAMLPQLEEVPAGGPFPEPGRGELMIAVVKGQKDGPKRQFVAVLTPEEFHENIQLQNLLKLVEISKS
jgi:hypothetical protein